jgi:hypothetical protein
VLPGFPLVYRQRCQDMDPPYRADPRALVVRIPRRRALVLGWWRETGFEDEVQALESIGFRGHEKIESDVRTLIEEHA